MNLDFLRPLYREIGNYARSTSTPTGSMRTPDDSLKIRWKNAREQLAAAGASPASLDAVAEVIGDPGEAAPGRAVFARGGDIAFTGALDAPPRREIARLAALPHLMPLMAQHPPPIPHVRVSATRVGGEIVAIGGSGDGWRDWVAGRPWPVHKAQVGGWSQDRYDRHTEELERERQGAGSRGDRRCGPCQCAARHRRRRHPGPVAAPRPPGHAAAGVRRRGRRGSHRRQPGHGRCRGPGARGLGQP